MPPTEEDLAWLRSTFHPIPRPALPDDCVEYSLYLIGSTVNSGSDSETKLRFRDIQKYASTLQKQWLKDYIWQRQSFGLEMIKEDGEVCASSKEQAENQLTFVSGVNILRGRTEYGDSIEDEWVVVWLLREISKNFDNLWIKINDSDGEFLLIEAAGTLPAWLEPEIAENRVWINRGGLKIIKPNSERRSSRQTTEKLSLTDARSIILSEPNRFINSTSIEEEAFFRLKDYPQKILKNMHTTFMRVPRKIAYLLRQKPAYVAPAIEAFYLRDPIALKPLQAATSESDLQFPPSDFVSISVKLPRVGYAQIKSQAFKPPQIWQSSLPPKADSKSFLQAEAGLKLSCGFEMLLSDTQHQDKPAVREMKMLLDDLRSGDEHLPTDEEISHWPQLEDDESWLDINFEDLEDELDPKSGRSVTGKKRAFGDKAAQENLQRMVKQFEEFLNDGKSDPDDSGLFNQDTDDEIDDSDDSEEAELSDDGEDKEASFDEDEFTKMMREMMGMPPEVMREIMTGKATGAASRAGRATSSQHLEDRKIEEVDSSDEDVSPEDMQELVQKMEAELHEKGALR